MLRSLPPLPAAFARFAISGGGVALVAVATYYLCAVPLALPPLLANLIAYLTQLVVGYQAHRIFSFRQQRRDRASMIRYALMSVGAFALNSLFVWALTDLAGLPRWTPIVPMVALTPLVTFALARYWVFADRDGPVLTLR